MSNMKYYTNVVPALLHSKLLEKGMPELLETYAEVFDWLLDKGICVNIHPDKYSHKSADMWRYTCYGKSNYGPLSATKGWIETAYDAILCAIEQLI